MTDTKALEAFEILADKMKLTITGIDLGTPGRHIACFILEPAAPVSAKEGENG